MRRGQFRVTLVPKFERWRVGSPRIGDAVVYDIAPQPLGGGNIVAHLK